MWYYIKQGFLPFIYLFFMAMTSIGILSIGSDLLWLKIILAILNLALYLVVVMAAAYKDGQEDYRTRMANDLERMEIVRTGEDRPLKLKEEYKAWKGFLNGAMACIPLVILMIVHTVLICIDSNLNGAGVIASMVYLVFFAFCRLDAVGAVTSETVVATVSPVMFYFTLIALPIIMLSTGIPYLLGAKKIELQQERIRERQRQIYGDDL